MLLDNYFLHFAGSGSDGTIWKNKNLLFAKDLKLLKKVNTYRKRKLKGLPKNKN